MTPLWILSICFSLANSVEIIKAVRGSPVHLPCEPVFQDDVPYQFEKIDRMDVEWFKDGRPTCRYFIVQSEINAVNCPPSFIPSFRGLNITSFERSHSGSYNCIVERLIPHPNYFFNSSTMELRIDGVDIEQVNTSISGCVKLLCILDDISQDQVVFNWFWGGHNRSDQVQVSSSSTIVNSSLVLCEPQWEDGDSITCSVSLPFGESSSSWTIRGQSGSAQTDSEIIKAVRGSPVHLPCDPVFQDDNNQYEKPGRMQVEWFKDGYPTCSYDIVQSEIIAVNCPPTFIPSLRGLKITSFERSHLGSYNCIVERLIPPPVQHFNSSTVELRKDDVDIEQVNTSSSGCVQLLCTLDDISQDQVVFNWFWRRNNRFDQVEVSSSSTSVNSSLSLCGSEWEDGDNIICSVSLPSGTFSSSWTIRGQSGPVQSGNDTWLTTTIICVIAGAAFIIIIIVIIAYKCEKRKEDDSMVYTTTVYQ